MEKHCDVILLEACDRVGGRGATVRDRTDDVPLELVAEFVHGSPPTLLRDFSEQHDGVTVYLEPGEAAIRETATLEVTVLNLLDNDRALAIGLRRVRQKPLLSPNAMDTAAVAALIRETGAEIVINVASPFVNGAVLEWKRLHQCAARGVTVLLGVGFDPGVVNVYVRLVEDEYLDTVEGWRWNAMFEVASEWDLPVVGRQNAYLSGHDEVHSLSMHHPAADVRFWMGFSDHLQRLRPPGGLRVHGQPGDFLHRGHPPGRRRHDSVCLHGYGRGRRVAPSLRET
ncbi:FAD-dependent oxidoreductase [Corallococcus sp. bb12-1]|uniref:FAD-dependent oxidoreductase n=1 Tax=Corallococcus sp. bb12-1 TaxID=2996784 RepID=UPI002271C37F|nr:FAD-dependent oxidoreductase [Corallococcus sp. bb12-1]MCY1046244.1 FAD-dependent oxidoreductase [Corallococcus sp. bb12-1]